MRTVSITAVLLTAAIMASFSVTEARAGLPAPPGLPAPNVNVNISGGVPAPPGVHVSAEDSRGYRNDGRRGHDNGRHEGRKLGHKKYKKHKKH